MRGQWSGVHINDGNSYPILLNLDDRGATAEGVLFLNFATNVPLPGIVVPISIPQTPTNKFVFTVDRNQYQPVDAHSLLPSTWHEYSQKFPDDQLPNGIFKFSGKRKGTELTITIESDNPYRSNTLTLHKRKQTSSALASERMTWGQFKERVNALEEKRYIFRGQNQTWSLRTTYHRTERADLQRFLTEDIATLNRQISGKLRHLFDLNIPDHNGAFFNMLQHHGYPTPILDWSRSPYVSAFFAFRGITRRQSQDGRNQHARIFVFDKQEWIKDYRQLIMLNTSGPHFSISEFMALNNDRLVPQQGIASISNIDDIERYISLAEKQNGKTYLSAIDIAWSARDEVMKDLSFMGITAGSLFPGIDGTCEELKERFFRV